MRRLFAVTTQSSLTVTGATVSEAQGATFTAVVGTFTDATTGGGVGSYSATIDWGDGHSTTGLIAAGANGVYNVSGTEVYASQGTYPIGVTVIGLGGASATATGQANVADAPLSLLAASQTLYVSSFNGGIATFTGGMVGPASSFSASIDWGDGTTSSGTINLSNTGSGGSAVSGSVIGHKDYAAPGTYTVTTKLQDGAGTTTQSQGQLNVKAGTASGIGPSLVVTTADLQVSINNSFSGTVASFVDDTPPGTPDPGAYTATIDWGDGQRSAGSVSGGGGGVIRSPARIHTLLQGGYRRP